MNQLIGNTMTTKDNFKPTYYDRVVYIRPATDKSDAIY